MENLIKELQIKIIEALDLVDVTPADIPAEEPLIGGKLGIDSIDVLELVMMVEKDYGVVIDNQELGTQVFASLKALADYINGNRPEKAI
jgi:acyl carrier protein